MQSLAKVQIQGGGLGGEMRMREMSQFPESFAALARIQGIHSVSIQKNGTNQ